MTLKKFVLLLVVVMPTLTSQAQIIDPDLSITEAGNTPGFVREMKPKVESPYAKNYYLRDQWQNGSIQLKEGELIENIPIKYDIVKNLIEVQYDSDIYYVSTSSVQSFSWFDYKEYRKSNFYRCRDFKVETNENEKIVGFFEQIYEGPTSLYIHHDINVFQANSSVSLSGSHRSNDIIWEQNYFINYDGKLVELHPKRKPNLYLFNEFSEEILTFMRNEGLWFKTEDHIIAVLEHYNGLQVQETP